MTHKYILSNNIIFFIVNRFLTFVLYNLDNSNQMGIKTMTKYIVTTTSNGLSERFTMEECIKIFGHAEVRQALRGRHPHLEIRVDTSSPLNDNYVMDNANQL